MSRDRARDAVDGGRGRDRAFADPRDRVRHVELVRRRDPTWGDLRP